MTLTDTKIYALAAVLSIFCVSAWAASPSRDLLNRAQNAVASADDLHAIDYAPVEFETAVAQMNEAEARFEKRRYKNADIAAQQAEVNALLALAKLRAAQARQLVQKKSEENRQLRRDLLGDEGAEQ